jgi:hypothetical protein
MHARMHRVERMESHGHQVRTVQDKARPSVAGHSQEKRLRIQAKLPEIANNLVIITFGED